MPHSRFNANKIILLLIGLLVFPVSILVSARHLKTAFPSAEATVRTAIAEEITGMDSKGYHALLDSALMPPLPTLFTYPLLLPSAWLTQKIPHKHDLAFYLLLGLTASAATIYIITLSRQALPFQHTPGTPRTALEICATLPGLLLALILFLAPASPIAVAEGRSETGSVFFAAAILCHFSGWLRTGKMRSLALASLLHAIACLWDVRFVVFIPAVLALVAARAGRMHQSPHEKGKLQAFLLLYLTPALYLPGLWILFGWLIFAHPLWMTRDATPEFAQAVKTLAIAALCSAPILWLLTRHTRAMPYLAALLILPAAGGLAWSASRPLTPETQAVTGQIIETPAQKQELANLDQYLAEHKGGHMILVIGRPGYQLKKIFYPRANVLHRLDLWDIDNILRATKGREVLLVLGNSQISLWKKRLGELNWEKHFVMDSIWENAQGKTSETEWKVFHCIRSK